jgi:hypothetical protein
MWEFVIGIVLVVLCPLTGHGFLWAVTRGRWKPFEKGTYKDDVATLVGLPIMAGAFALIVLVMR